MVAMDALTHTTEFSCDPMSTGLAIDMDPKKYMG
jgi:hypothetical protein